MLTTILALALAAPPADTVPRPSPQSEVAVVVHRQPALPLVALRLSLLADDPPGYAGAGHLFQHLHLPRLEEQAARVGGRVQAQRTADAIVYTVVGPATELEYLAGVLSTALRAPAASTAELLASLRALADERAEERETAPAYVRAALRARLFPSSLSPAGTDAAAQRLATARLTEVWGSMYRPSRVSIVAVGDAEPDGVRRAFRNLPEPPEARLEAVLADTARTLVADTPQATRGWIGRGWRAEGSSAAALSVTARLLRSTLQRRLPSARVESEHWWTAREEALAVVVAAPEASLPQARQALAGALAALRTVDEAAVRDAAAGVRRELLFYARTPERMAEVLGSFVDRGEAPDAAQRFYTALDEVTVEDVRTVLNQLSKGEAVTVEVPPQKVRTDR